MMVGMFSDFRYKLYRGLLLLVVFGLSACAFSPQQLTVAPQLTVVADSVGAGKVVSITVTDARANPVLGYRGGVYRESSTIKAQGLESGLAKSLVVAMQNLGYTVSAESGAEDIRIAVFIDQLDLGSPDVLYSNKINMATTLRVEAYRENRKFTNSYGTRGERRFSLAPGKAVNEKLVNEILASTLSRLFNDAAFLAFIS